MHGQGGVTLSHTEFQALHNATHVSYAATGNALANTSVLGTRSSSGAIKRNGRGVSAAAQASEAVALAKKNASSSSSFFRLTPLPTGWRFYSSFAVAKRFKPLFQGKVGLYCKELHREYIASPIHLTRKISPTAAKVLETVSKYRSGVVFSDEDMNRSELSDVCGRKFDRVFIDAKSKDLDFANIITYNRRDVLLNQDIIDLGILFFDELAKIARYHDLEKVHEKAKNAYYRRRVIEKKLGNKRPGFMSKLVLSAKVYFAVAFSKRNIDAECEFFTKDIIKAYNNEHTIKKKIRRDLNVPSSEDLQASIHNKKTHRLPVNKKDPLEKNELNVEKIKSFFVDTYIKSTRKERSYKDWLRDSLDSGDDVREWDLSSKQTVFAVSDKQKAEQGVRKVYDTNQNLLFARA